MANVTRNIGLSLGADICWPGCYEELIKRLQDLGKPFEVMPYPGSKHGLLRFQSTGPHAYHTVAAFFDRTLRADPSPAPARSPVGVAPDNGALAR